MNIRKLTTKQWGRFCLSLGIGGMLLLYAVGLIPLVQVFLSKTETGVFVCLNRLLGHNPVWDWTILVGASDFWIALSYGAAFLLFILAAWQRREEDYGQLFGYAIFVLLVVIVTEEMADLIADNLHRMLPWKQGVLAQMKLNYDADFFKMHKDEGIVDDSASALFCLYFLIANKSTRTGLVSLALIVLYVFSSLIVGTQWLSVQLASALMGAFFAGLALTYSPGLIRYLEKETSNIFVACLGQLLLGRKIIDRRQVDKDTDFWMMVQDKARKVNVLSRRWFWERIVKRQALLLLNADPQTTTLYSSPDMTMERVKSGGRVRFLKTGEREIFVVRAMRYVGGFFHTSPKFTRFTESVKNNVYLERLGFPVPRVIWTQEGLTSLGLRNYFFAIEEYLDCRPLNPAARIEVERAMRLLARLHQHTFDRWGGLYDEAPRSRTQFILQYLRGEVLYDLKRIEMHYQPGWNAAEISAIWKLFEAAAIEVFFSDETTFRLVHGDVTPRNFCVGPEARILMIDFLTVHTDLAGWEVIKGTISLTREHPAHGPLAWQAYFEEAGEARWRAFLVEAKLALARFALRELAHKRVKLAAGQGKEQIQQWIASLFTSQRGMWGATPSQTQWEQIFKLLGIHQQENGDADVLEHWNESLAGSLN